MLGFDPIFDSNFKVKFLEINNAPVINSTKASRTR